MDENDLYNILSATDILGVHEHKVLTQHFFSIITADVYACDSIINVKMKAYVDESTNGPYVIALGLRAIEDEFFECREL